MTSTRPANNFLQRLLGAAALDTAIYEEVEADPKAGVQAAVVVVLSSLAAGIGARGFDENSISNIALISISGPDGVGVLGAADLRDRRAAAAGVRDVGRCRPVDADDWLCRRRPG